MGIQDEIAEKLREGYTPQQVIEMGYRKSTVYKVYSSIRAFMVPVSPPEWAIENITPSVLRCLPGRKITITFTFKNNSARDMYLYQIGIHPEWIQDPQTWLAQEVRDLIKTNQKRFFSFILPVPDIALGEYTLIFGINAQYLPATNYAYQPMQTQWSEPVIIHVKHPLSGTKVFLSHSTKDMQIVRELEKRLDNYGIEPIIAEDILEPGGNLEEKFQSKIRNSTIFLAILTEESVRSKWVIKETEYAQSIGKPSILLKEESLKYQSDVEWREFSKYDPPEIIFQKVMQAIEAVQPAISPIGAILGIGILIFIAALFLGGGD